VLRTTGRKATVTTTVAPSPLTASDRCDRCGAQAYLRVHLESGSELLFCGHHAREHGEKLRTIAVNVHDETSKLLDTPSVAPADER
jgi:hypothetical protein